MLNRTKYQYSFLLARPENTAYFFSASRYQFMLISLWTPVVVLAYNRVLRYPLSFLRVGILCTGTIPRPASSLRRIIGPEDGWQRYRRCRSRQSPLIRSSVTGYWFPVRAEPRRCQALPWREVATGTRTVNRKVSQGSETGSCRSKVVRILWTEIPSPFTLLTCRMPASTL